MARTRSSIYGTTTFRSHKVSTLWLTTMTVCEWGLWGAHEDAGRRWTLGRLFCLCLLIGPPQCHECSWDHRQAGCTLCTTGTGTFRPAVPPVEMGSMRDLTGCPISSGTGNELYSLLPPSPPFFLSLWCECQKLSARSVTVCASPCYKCADAACNWIFI